MACFPPAMEDHGCIFFIYDSVIRSRLREEDDPTEAISYFYPAERWEKEQQRWLCGALVDLSHILGYHAELIKLKTRKFALTKTNQFIIVLGIQNEKFSDSALTDALEYLKVIILFFYPSFHYLLSSAAKDQTLNCIIESLMKKHWTEIEFHPVAYVDYGKLKQPTIMKCADVLNFISRNNGVFGCCLYYRNKLIQSNMGKKITRLVKFCLCCDLLRKKMGIDENRRSFSPVFLSVTEYEELVRKLRQRFCDIEWEPYMSSELSDPGDSSLADAVETEIQDEPYSLGNLHQSGSDILLVDDTMPRSDSVPSQHSEQSQSTDAEEEEENNPSVEENIVPSSLEPEMPQPSSRNRSYEDSDACELALCIIKVGELFLAILMEKYSSQYSLKLAKMISHNCDHYLQDIHQEMVENSENRDEKGNSKQANESKTWIKHSAVTGKMEMMLGPDNSNLQKFVAEARNDFENKKDLSSVLLKDSRTSYECKKTFDASEFTVEVQSQTPYL